MPLLGPLRAAAGRCVLILTSNLPGDPAEFFTPEFINRIDEIVRSRALTEDDTVQVLEIQLHQLEARLAERRLALSVSDDARRRLAQRGYDPGCGARPLKRLIQHAVVDPLALEPLSGVCSDGDLVARRRGGGRAGPEVTAQPPGDACQRSRNDERLTTSSPASYAPYPRTRPAWSK